MKSQPANLQDNRIANNHGRTDMNHGKTVVWITLLVAILLRAACGRDEEPTPIPTPTPLPAAASSTLQT